MISEKGGDPRRGDGSGGEDDGERLGDAVDGAAAALGRAIDSFGDVVERATDRLAEALGAIPDAEIAVPAPGDIDLPELEPQPGGEIVRANLRAVQVIYFAALLEETKLFQVADRLVELFQQGHLPIGQGGAGDLLHRYWKKEGERLSEAERQALYARTLGLGGGDAEVAKPNHEFNDLFLRFLAAISSYARQYREEDIPSPSSATPVTGEEVRKSARDLAVNLSLHGYGAAHAAAVRLQEQISDVLAILSNSEVRDAYGARDGWQVVDRVAMQELGGATNGARYRAMARSGAIVIRWLAERADELIDGSGELLDRDQLRSPSATPADHEPLKNPTDRDLVDAVEQWLVVVASTDP